MPKINVLEIFLVRALTFNSRYSFRNIQEDLHFHKWAITGKQPAFCRRISARDESERSDTRVGRFTLEEDFI
jgi:hypothetical protein